MWPAIIFWQAGLPQALFYVSIIIGTIILTLRCVVSRSHYKFYSENLRAGHRWFFDQAFNQFSHCNICECLLLNTNGACCECCGIYVDVGCIKDADIQLLCKPTYVKSDKLKHHWVKGNLPHYSKCHICEEECDTIGGLTDFRCSWCQRTVHVQCLPNMASICDLGMLFPFIISPTLFGHDFSIKQKEFQIFLDKNANKWSPILVLGNDQAGGRDGRIALKMFRYFLNPCQVFDLASCKSEDALKICKSLHGIEMRILIGGGDGTINWILNTIDKLQLEPLPSIALLPLGTGNDLSRTFGWGNSYCAKDINPILLLKNIMKSEKVLLDRWKIEIQLPIHLGIRLPSQKFYMNNYLSIGVDALVTLNFHETRNSSPFYMYSSRLFNKLIYFTYGTRDVLERECKNLDKHVVVFLDDKKVSLPYLEAILILNIPFWGGGVKPWDLGNSGVSNQSYNDGILEVLGIYSSFHIAQLQVGLSEPICLGQARCITISRTVPMQIDGEPWKQYPCVVSIKHSSQAVMLKNTQ